MRLLNKRSRLWVDPAFQLRLILRMAAYLLVYLFIVWHLGFLFEMTRTTVSGSMPKSSLELYVDYFAKQQSTLYTLLLLLPVYCYDLLRFSHRVAGPLVRCRTLMREMADGKVVPEFKPRKYDLMRDLFEAFNVLIRHCNARVTCDSNRPAPAAGAATRSDRETGVTC